MGLEGTSMCKFAEVPSGKRLEVEDLRVFEFQLVEKNVQILSLASHMRIVG